MTPTNYCFVKFFFGKSCPYEALKKEKIIASVKF